MQVEAKGLRQPSMMDRETYDIIIKLASTPPHTGVLRRIIQKPIDTLSVVFSSRNCPYQMYYLLFKVTRRYEIPRQDLT